MTELLGLKPAYDRVTAAMLRGHYFSATLGKSEKTSKKMLTLGTEKLYFRLLFSFKRKWPVLREPKSAN